MSRFKKEHKKIGDVLDSFVTQRKIENGYNEVSIQKFWQVKMGTMINKYTTNITLNNKVLKVYISSSSLKQELNYSKPKIMSLLEEEFGPEYVEEIQIR